MENILFSYSAVVADIITDTTGEPTACVIMVSIEGRAFMVHRKMDPELRKLNLVRDMRLIVDGIENDKGYKHLGFRKALPCPLSEYEKELLKDIVDSFNGEHND